jgi:amino acid transporter
LSARRLVRLGGGSFDMVAVFEIVFLILFAVIGVWWFRRTNLYRAHRSSGADTGQSGTHRLTGRGDQNMSGPR